MVEIIKRIKIRWGDRGVDNLIVIGWVYWEREFEISVQGVYQGVFWDYICEREKKGEVLGQGRSWIVVFLLFLLRVLELRGFLELFGFGIEELGFYKGLFRGEIFSQGDF